MPAIRAFTGTCHGWTCGIIRGSGADPDTAWQIAGRAQLSAGAFATDTIDANARCIAIRRRRARGTEDSWLGREISCAVATPDQRDGSGQPLASSGTYTGGCRKCRVNAAIRVGSGRSKVPVRIGTAA